MPQRSECWPHRYESSWSKQEGGVGVIFCTACGHMLELNPDKYGPIEDRENWNQIKDMLTKGDNSNG